MTIEGTTDGIVAFCNFCNETAEEDDEGNMFSDFTDAINWKKEHWPSIYFKGEWQDVCPACYEKLGKPS